MHARPAVVDRDQDGVVLALDPDPNLRPGRRVLERVREQVVHDPLHLRRIDLGEDRLGPDLEPGAVRHMPGRHLLDEPADVGRAEAGTHDPVPETVEVEQIREQALEPAGLVDEVVDDAGPRLSRERASVLPQGHGEAEDRGQRRPELVRDRREDGVAQLVELPPLGDVLRRSDHADGGPRLVGDDAPPSMDPANPPVRDDDPVVVRERLSARAGARDSLANELAVLGVDAREVRLVRHRC